MEDQLAVQQKVLLEKLDEAPDRTLGQSKLKLDKDVQEHLGLNKTRIGEVFSELAQQGYVEEVRKPRAKTVSYRLTDAGVAHLQTLPAYRPPPPKLPETTPERFDIQKAFLLTYLRDATDQSVSKADFKIGADVQKIVGLTKAQALAVLDFLAYEGYVERIGAKKSPTWTLTNAGAEHLQTLPPWPPELPEDPNLLPFQRAFLLLQLLSAEGQTLTAGVANKLPLVAKQDLEMKPPLADQLRRKMAKQGYLRMEEQGRSTHLTLTAEGKRYLATLRHHPAASFIVTGEALNQLIDAVRVDSGGAGTDRSQPSDTPMSEVTEVTAKTLPGDLSRVVYDEFRDLLRERHSTNRLVPIFEIRRQIASKYGPGVAQHETLDRRILQLSREGRVRLVSISDLRRAAPDELHDSIKTGYETFFYMEDADDHSGSR